jgi:hypothetical protein
MRVYNFLPSVLVDFLGESLKYWGKSVTECEEKKRYAKNRSLDNSSPF